jgi:hypothetical protein
MGVGAVVVMEIERIGCIFEAADRSERSVEVIAGPDSEAETRGPERFEVVADTHGRRLSTSDLKAPTPLNVFGAGDGREHQDGDQGHLSGGHVPSSRVHEDRRLFKGLCLLPVEVTPNCPVLFLNFVHSVGLRPEQDGVNLRPV